MSNTRRCFGVVATYTIVVARRRSHRTSVLSKSWLQAWSTIPTLRFCVLKEQEKRNHMKLVDMERTLIRYHHENIPIEKLELLIDIDNQESASVTERWIQSVATKSCLKELSLDIRLFGASLRLPDEILSGENLTKITISASSVKSTVFGLRVIRVPPKMVNHFVSMKTTHHPKCLSLRELHLSSVIITEVVLHDILSSCRLLEKIELLHCSQGLKAIKVENLPWLYKLHIATFDGNSTSLEVNHVPNLRFFSCSVDLIPWSKRPLKNAHLISLGSNVTELTLCSILFRNKASLDKIINSGLHFIESLTLDLTCWTSRSFRFTCASMKRFSLFVSPLVDVVHVIAPKLHCFSLTSRIMPRLLFPDSTLKQIRFWLRLAITDIDASFFLKMRKALKLARVCEVHIKMSLKNHDVQPFEIDIDDLRSRLPFRPAINVEKMFFIATEDECMWERSPFFDAFFEICHPKDVYAFPDSQQLKHNNHFCRLMLKEVLGKSKNKETIKAYWPSYLKHVQMKRVDHEKRETLTDSHKSFLDGPGPLPVKFILYWH
uniref:F-box/LRR-repeat protein 15/At3g58940/PEG3-like LRR domain-containing protein n=1 Tax=Lactuca sativa TaxID=4236 RepID=A0A9R1VDT0_LACSA|nr:hypothetical protein LSAT_V11C500248630 [Lactuca sativa]